MKNKIEIVMQKSSIPVPDWWVSEEDGIRNVIETEVKKGKVEIISLSPGKHKVLSVTYGDFEEELRGTANFNSALGGKSPESYFKRGPGVRKNPVLMVLAGVHGQEVEGMVAALSLIKIMETGRDIKGDDKSALLDKLGKLRLIIIPVANPDGRIRVPYKGWCGLTASEKAKWGQGTRMNGELYNWPYCKKVHPMKGDVGILGGYFDNNGINMSHDEWFSPMSQTTSAILNLAAQEGPDMLLNLHSYDYDAQILTTNYVPYTHKVKLKQFAEMYYSKMEEAKLPHLQAPVVEIEGKNVEIPPAFNLTSMLYHAGVDISLTFETPQGLIGTERSYDYNDILDIHHILFASAADYLIKNLKI